jgi:hypothetical protein
MAWTRDVLRDQRRYKLGLKLQAFADKARQFGAKVTPQSCSHYENGKYKPPYWNVIPLAKAYEVEPEAIREAFGLPQPVSSVQ